MNMPAPEKIDLGIDRPAERDLEFVYVGDPMCSWCWGFAPALASLDGRYGIPVRTVMGGLRTGAEAQPMDAAARGAMTRYWQQVAEQSGQPFTNASLEREGWTYDTEPSCRAVVAMRELAPHETLRWVARLHRAFYVEGVDITDQSVFVDLLDGFDQVDRDRYAELVADPATPQRTRQDFEEARGYGVTGYPTLLFRDGVELGLLTQGFIPWDQLEPALTRWLEQRYGALPGGSACDLTSGRC